MKEHTPTGTLHCYWSDLKEHPKCIHGPGLLFGREVNGEINKFYACSACRDRKICSFYAEYGKKTNKQDEEILKKQKKKNLPWYNHQKLFIFFNHLMSQSPLQRAYCHTCEKLLLVSEKDRHKDHEITENLSDYQMTNPTEVFKPLENSKKEAQYLFSKKAVKDIVDLLITLNAENILCIGAPRIHEYVSQNLEGKMSSLLLDFDGRFHNFFGPLNYCWYNLFNHHFFQEDSKDVFQEFLKQNNGKNMYLICDPPFGGRVEPISQTLKHISDLHKKLNKISDSKDELKILFIFPYYMEAIMREKSNPQNISGGLKELKMTDYKVEYDNHPLFVSKANGEKQGSQVRIFTNIPLDLIKLPEEDGYKYCKRCQRWVASENKHCKLCHSCTSKDGRRYRHCKLCERCVKPTWAHCRKCNRCTLPTHKCGQKPNIGSCFKCNKTGHTEKDCSIKNSANPGKILKIKKRKSADESIDDMIPVKRCKDRLLILKQKKKVKLSTGKVSVLKTKNNIISSCSN